MNQDHIARHRRIVVALDSGELDTVHLERLARLARRLGAELEGVFVEDSDLLRLSELTFVQEFRPTSQRSERFQAARMQQELRVVARRAERALATYAEHRGVHWSFRVWRGSMEHELITAMEADVLALTRLGAVLMGPAPHRERETVTACFDGSEGSARALVTAAELAPDSGHVTLQVLLEAGSDEKSAALQQQAREVLSNQLEKAYEGKVAYASLNPDDWPRLLNLLLDSNSSALVMQRDDAMLRHTSLRERLAHLSCPLFLVK